MTKDEPITKLGNGIAPISLGQLKNLHKHDLIQIILIREIRVKQLQDEWKEAIKDARVKEFLLRELKCYSRSRNIRRMLKEVFN